LGVAFGGRVLYVRTCRRTTTAAKKPPINHPSSITLPTKAGTVEEVDASTVFLKHNPDVCLFHLFLHEEDLVKLHGVPVCPPGQTGPAVFAPPPFYHRTTRIDILIPVPTASFPYIHEHAAQNMKLLKMYSPVIMFGFGLVRCQVSPPRFHEESAQGLSRLFCPDQRNDRHVAVAHDSYRDTITPWVRKETISNASYSTVMVKRYRTFTPRARRTGKGHGQSRRVGGSGRVHSRPRPPRTVRQRRHPPDLVGFLGRLSRNTGGNTARAAVGPVTS
jgi:hypothetical protein